VAELTIRLVASLAVVVGLMLLLARLVGKRYGARAGAPVQVLHRQPLSRSSSVAVVTVGSRVLVVGTTDHQVSLLAELDPEELDTTDLEVDAEEVRDLHAPTVLHTAPAARTTQPGAHRGARRAEVPRREPDAGGLAGSVLSPQTWRQALAAATGKAS
jgi:flagellar protein FliO/FliZ